MSDQENDAPPVADEEIVAFVRFHATGSGMHVRDWLRAARANVTVLDGRRRVVFAAGDETWTSRLFTVPERNDVFVRASNNRRYKVLERELKEDGTIEVSVEWTS